MPLPFKPAAAHRPLILCIAILFTLFASFVPVKPLPVPMIIKRLDGSIITPETLTREIGRLRDDAHIAGISVTVLNDNRVVYSHAFGYKNVPAEEPLTNSSSIYAASLSKAVFAVMVMKLVETHQLDLDKPLQQYLDTPVYAYPARAPEYWASDYSSLRGDTQYTKITARMCLSHTTGFANWRWLEPDQKLHIHFTPGTKFLYSGEGLCYLQFILEHKLHTSLNELAQRLIFNPLGMTHSGYTWQPEWESIVVRGHDTINKMYPLKKYFVARAASTLETTPNEYALFMQGLLLGKLLNPASMKELFTPQIRIRTKRQFPVEPGYDKDTSMNDAIKLSYGLGWGLLQSPYGPGAFKEGHGDGFQHYSIVFPEKKTGILIMTNSDNGEGVFKELLETAIGDKYTPWYWENYIPYNWNVKAPN
ncbi:MAG TPA: serine hydrolase domain-containing protein [Chitinophagaceae bacterium]|jgi:CubicO group peptidase (beta-lactamase class C family)